MGEQKRTQFAMQAFGFAEVFNMKIGDQPVAGHGVKMAAPDGPSTGGGKQSVQHISLVPAGGGSVIVAGSADQMEKRAELRSHAYLSSMHAQRFRGKELPIGKADYDALVKRMMGFFAEQGLTVVMIEAPSSVGGGASIPAAATSPGKGVMVAVFVVVAVAIAAVVFLLLRK